MEQEQRIEESGNPMKDTTQDYISAINEIKKNSVSKSEYDKLREENKNLLNSLVNGQNIEQEEAPIDIGEIRKDLIGKEMSNLEFCSKAIELRKEVMENGGVDPFLPFGKNILPNDDDVRSANKVAGLLEYCIERAEGDNSVFTNELQRHLVDPPLPKRRIN